MSKCRYPRSVIKNNIDVVEDENGECCYKVVIPICSTGKDVLVICRRPNPIGDEFCNRLLSRIVKEVLDRFEEVKSITCVCLVCSYEISKVYDNTNLEKQNLKILKEEIELASLIVAAWGEPYKGYEELFNEKITFLYEYMRDATLKSNNRKIAIRIGELTKKGYPKHYLAWKSDDVVKYLM